MEGIERLEAEVLEMNNKNISAIFEYLKTREDLYENFNNTEKNIHQMYKFIYERARGLKQDNVAMVSDKLVYLWAVTYFNTSNEKLGLSSNFTYVSKSSKSNTETKKEEKKQEEKKKDDDQITLFQEVQ